MGEKGEEKRDAQTCLLARDEEWSDGERESQDGRGGCGYLGCL